MKFDAVFVEAANALFNFFADRALGLFCQDMDTGANGDDDDFESVLKLQKATMSISEDMLHSLKLWATENAVICIMSLYEADAGLQHLEDTGITDGTFSEDADFFALNSRL